MRFALFQLHFTVRKTWPTCPSPNSIRAGLAFMWVLLVARASALGPKLIWAERQSLFCSGPNYYGPCVRNSTYRPKSNVDSTLAIVHFRLTNMGSTFVRIASKTSKGVGSGRFSRMREILYMVLRSRETIQPGAR